jgi:hypothetical protein
MTQEATGAALVERVARAMFLDGVANVEVAISGDVWSSLSAGSRKVWLSQARAAIREIAEAMREPSEDAVISASQGVYGDNEVRRIHARLFAATALAEAVRDGE